MLGKNEIEFKNKILNETNSKKINDLLISNKNINFIDLFSDSEFMEHLKKYFKLSEDEKAKHIYIRKAERKDIGSYNK